MDSELSDLDIVKRCAVAMGYALEEYARGWRCKRGKETHCVIPLDGEKSVISTYNPLVNKAQAMDLVIKFKLNIAQLSTGDCKVFTGDAAYEADSTDLLRAICLCAARIPHG